MPNTLLETAIEQFKDYVTLAVHFRDWSTQEGALNECDYASQMFIRWLNEHGFALGQTEYTFNAGTSKDINPALYNIPTHRNESGSFVSEWHAIVELDDCFIDWTARQYKADAPYPYIQQKEGRAREAASGASL